MRNLSFINKKLPVMLVVFLFLAAGRIFAQDHGDAIVTGSIGDARTLVPILASDTSSSEITGMIFNGLVKYDKNINLIGDLAEGWDIEDGGLTIVFHLRKNVFWQDGHPFTARDVEYTYQKLIDPAVRTPYSGDFERVKSLQVLDDYTIKVTYGEPFSPGLSSWGMPIMPRHILEKEDLNKTDFSRHPVGTGPYVFKSWKTQEKIELVANKNYFEGEPYISRYIYRVIPDESTLFLELQTEGVDSTGLSPLQYLRQTDTPFLKERYRKFRLPSFGFTYLGYNLNNEKFKDIRVRQALNYAVDKGEIVRIVLLGLGRPSTGPFVPDSWAYNKDVASSQYDPEKAKDLLKEAGWQDLDNDGILEKGGARFEFTIITNQGNEERLKSAQIIQRRLKEIGVNVKIKVLEWSVFLSEYIDKRKFDTVLLGWALARDPDCFDIFHSSKTKEGEFNFVGYSNAQVDKLLDEGRRTFDQQERAGIYRKIHELIYADQPYMFLFVGESLSILHRRFQGVEPAPIGIGYNFIKWYVPSSEQKYKK
ncbi:MAG: peptide-binding protein [Candidatus Omnitrophica bacterium]|nr:peptide-binding protein [Candidatus Omnitrophota bacterium]MDD5654922.1 peptide-binding protein [Candidatus Omnitrophota bacterium]